MIRLPLPWLVFTALFIFLIGSRYGSNALFRFKTVEHSGKMSCIQVKHEGFDAQGNEPEPDGKPDIYHPGNDHHDHAEDRTEKVQIR